MVRSAPAVLALLALLPSCNADKEELHALCTVQGVEPRSPSEPLGRYLSRIAGPVAPKVWPTLSSLPLQERPATLRKRAFKATIANCPLADSWEMEELVGETRARPTEGVQLRLGGAADLKARLAATRAVRQVLDDAGHASVRVNGALESVDVEVIAVEVPHDADRAAVEKLLATAPALKKLGLAPRPAVNIHGTVLDP